MKRILLVVLLLILFAVPPAGAAPVSTPEAPLFSDLRISQVYGGGGNTGATYTHDFIELFNAGTTVVNITGWSVQYASAAGTSWAKTDLSGAIQPSGYFLVQEAQGAGGTTPLPTPDATGSIAMSGSNGKVALASNATAITGKADSDVVDFVGYGTANEYEGSAAAPGLGNTTADLRAGNGCTDSDNNTADFTAGTPNPRNSSSATNTCAVVDIPPTVLSTIPGKDASGVAATSSITVNFSENVTVTGAWFQISCASTGMHTAVVSGGAQSYLLNPNSDFGAGELCTVSIYATQVQDQDVPLDYLTTDYQWSFTVVSADSCNDPFTPIYTIQGSAATPAITGAVTTQGVVVGDYEVPTSGTGQLRGFYIQDLAGDGNPATSDGLFVFSPGADSVSVGQLVRVAGTASDYQDQTQVSSVTSLIQCGTTGGVTPVDVALPLASATALEPFEGMLVRFPQTLYVTEHFQLARFGQVVMSSGGRLAQPTNVVAPGADALAMQAANNLNRIIVDDDTNVENPDPIKFGRGGNPLSASNTLRGADTATGLVGVLTYTYSGNSVSGNAYRLRPIGALNGAVNFAAANERPPAPAAAGRLRVTAANLLNYFNTFTGCTGGVSGAAMDCRGAGNQEEFDRQWPKTVANLVGGGADVIAIMEMENDGYGSTSAIQHLVDKLNAKADTGTYAFINPDTTAGTNSLGTDAIKVGLIYKPGKVTPVGTTAALNTDDFVNGGDSAARNRPALAQAFEENSTGKRFIVVANHLKSKGSACDAPDAGDGQGNCNAVRTNAANALTAWLAGNPTDTGDPDILIMGDLNAYAKEDPITAIKNAGYTNLPESLIGPSAYSYVFDGQWGYLDHALGTASLTAQVAGIVEWHINADEPSALDYNTDYKSATQINILYDDDQFRAGDHDPVIVGLNLTSSKAVILLPLIMSDR